MAKAELQELGEDTEGMAQSTSKLRDTVQSITGVDIMKSATEFKSTYDIILELSKVWEDIAEIDRTYLLELLGGKRGATAIAAAIQNVDDLERSYQSALNAAGSAEKENERYLNSIQGKLDQLTNSWQKMWTMTINSDAVKFLVDMANNLVKILNLLGGLDTILVPILAIAGVSNLNKIGGAIEGIRKVVGGLITSYKELRTVMASANLSELAGLGKGALSSILGIDQAKARQAITNIVNGAVGAFNASGSIDDIAKFIDGTDILITKELALDAARKNALKTILTQTAAESGLITTEQADSIVKTQLIALETEAAAATTAHAAAVNGLKIAMGLGIAIIGFMAVKALKAYSDEQQKIKERLEETTKAAEEQYHAFTEAKKHYDSLFDNNGTLKASETELAEAMSKINESLGTRGEKLKSLQGNTVAYTRELSKLVEMERMYARIRLEGQMEEAENSARGLTTRGSLSNESRMAASFSQYGLASGGDTGVISLQYTDVNNQIAAYTSMKNAMETVARDIAGLETDIGVAYADLVVATEKGTAAEKKAAQETYDSLEARKAALMEYAGVLDRVVAGGRDEIEKLASLKQQDIQLNYDTSTIVGLNDALDDYIAKLGLSGEYAEEFRDAMLDGFGATGAALREADTFVNELNDKLPEVDVTVGDIVSKLSNEDVFRLNDLDLASIAEGAQDADAVITRITEAIKELNDESKAAAVSVQTFSGALRSEQIDAYQSRISDLNDALADLTSGDASSYIDGLQKIQSIIDDLDLDIELTGHESVEDYRKLVDRLANESLDNLVEALNLDASDSGLIEALRAVAESSETIASSAEQAANGLSALSSAYSTVAGAIEEYNEKGYFTISTIDSLLKLEPEYLSMLTAENGQLVLNQEALQKIAIARIEAAQQAAVENAAIQVGNILKGAETRANSAVSKSANQAALQNNNLAKQVGNVASSLSATIPALVEYNKLLGGVTSAGLTKAEEASINAINKGLEETLKGLEASKKAISNGASSAAHDIMGYSSKAAKGASGSASDASKDIKSAIDSVLSHFKSAMDNGAITYKQYLDKMKSLTDKYQNQLSKEDYWALRLQHAEGVFDMWGQVEAAVVRYLDDQTDAIQDQIDALDEEKDALERNKKQIEDYYDSIINGYKKQKEALDDQKDAIKDYYGGLMKPLEQEKKALEDNIKAYQKRLKEIEKQEKAINKQIKALQKQQKPYQQQQKEIEKQIKGLERQIADIEKLKSPYEDQIELLQKQKELMEAANDERERAIALQEAQYALERAQNQRTRMVYDNGQFVYQTDPNAIKDAQKQLDELEYQATLKAIDDAIADLQKHIDDFSEQADGIQKDIDALNEKNQELQDHIDLINESIDTLNEQIEVLKENAEPINEAIDGLNERMDDLKDRIDIIKDAQDEELDIIEAQIDGIEREIDAYERMKDQAVEGIDAQIAALDEQTDALERQIAEIEKYKEKWEDVIRQWERIKDEQLLTDIFGEGWQEKLNSLDPGILQTFTGAYFSAGRQMQEVNRQIIESLGSVEAALKSATGAGSGFRSTMNGGGGSSSSSSSKVDPRYAREEARFNQDWSKSHGGALASAKRGVEVATQARDAFSSSSSSIQNDSNKINQNATTTESTVTKSVNNAKDRIRTAFGEIDKDSKNLKDGVDKANKSIVDSTSKAKKNVVTINGETFNSVDVASNDIGRAWNTLSSKGDEMVRTTDTQTSSIRRTWNSLVDFMSGIRRTASDILDGINDRIRGAQNAFSNFSFGGMTGLSYRYYAKGGRVEIPTAAAGRRVTQTGPKHPLAKAVGEDVMIAAKAGEGIFTERQTDDLEQFIKLTPELIKSVDEFKHLGKLMEINVRELPNRMAQNFDRMLASQNTNNRTNIITIGDINLSDVQNVSDFARQLKANLPNAVLQELMA